MYCATLGQKGMGQLFTFASVLVEYRASENVTPGYHRFSLLTVPSVAGCGWFLLLRVVGALVAEAGVERRGVLLGLVFRRGRRLFSAKINRNINPWI